MAVGPLRAAVRTATGSASAAGSSSAAGSWAVVPQAASASDAEPAPAIFRNVLLSTLMASLPIVDMR